jgi:hypothetical protein
VQSQVSLVAAAAACRPVSSFCAGPPTRSGNGPLLQSLYGPAAGCNGMEYRIVAVAAVRPGRTALIHPPPPRTPLVSSCRRIIGYRALMKMPPASKGSTEPMWALVMEYAKVRLFWCQPLQQGDLCGPLVWLPPNKAPA